jgi:hypothetical protein
MREGGFEIDGFNDFTRGTIYYDIYDPEIFRKALDYMPKAMRRVMWTYLERRLAPWGGRVPLRVDWFAGKGLRPREPQVIERPVAAGKLVSDHNPILVDLELGAEGEPDPPEENDE